MSIRTVFVHVTAACNLRCEYCYLAAGEPAADELTAKEYEHLWEELVCTGTRKVVLTGGEPLLRSDILDLLHGLRRADPHHRLLSCLNTNGYLVTPQLARQLVGLVDEVRVSVDALAERNDLLRGSGSFRAALEALECLHAVGFEPRAMITVTPVGLPDLTDLLYLLFQRHITRANLNPVREVGRAGGRGGWWVDCEEVSAAVEEAWWRCCPDRDSFPRPNTRTLPRCALGSVASVTPQGEVFPCHVLTLPEFSCGNVRTHGWTELCSRLGLPVHMEALLAGPPAAGDEASGARERTGGCMGESYRDTVAAGRVQ